MFGLITEPLGGTMANDIAETARLVLLERLLNDLKSVKYPSNNVMDRIEKLLTTTDEAMYYLSLLMEKTQNRYPSFELIDRAQRVVYAISSADEREPELAETGS
jgi:hypothetical protein